MNDWLTRQVDTGRFVRTRSIWTPESWDDGYVNKGRFKVYRPDCPRAFVNGYALRSQVVWWLAHGEACPEDRQLHHKNEDKLDDRLDNLEMLTGAEHQQEHAKKSRVEFHCARCDKLSSTPRHRVRYGKLYCSQQCYNQRNR